MINRVWKRTLYKLGTVVGIIVGAVAYAATGMYIGSYFFGSKEGGLFGFYACAFIAYVVHWTYQASKREIEYENDKLMRQLQLDDAKKRLKDL